MYKETQTALAQEKNMSNENSKLHYVEVTAEALPLFCPTPSVSLWSSHPRVAIPVEKLGEAMCPYCGTRYKFKGELPHGHH
jgi:uncharacterized Zn-finger protein